MKDQSLFMKRVIHKSTPVKHPDTTLPEILDISLEEFVDYYPDWVMWRALDKRYTPTQIRQQPRRLLQVFIYFEMMLEKMSEEIREQDRLQQEAENG